MIEGWHGDEYLILFDEAECDDLTRRYDLHAYIPDHGIVGLRGWDDFILQNSQGDLLTTPTVPLSHQYLAPLAFVIQRQQIQVDERLRGKIKWYINPLVFGGDPASSDNLAWVTLEQHVELVKWFNRLYKQITAP
jgi:hypothetical protein